MNKRTNLSYAKMLSALILLLTILTKSYGQSGGSVTGRIKNSQGEPVPFATVFIEKTSQGAVADSAGSYSISNISQGKHEISCRMMGYSTQVSEVEVKGGETVNINFRLATSESVLQQVEIIGRKEQSYKNSNSFIVTKTEIELKETPQSVSYVTKELILDQGLTRVGEVVKNMSGVNQFTFYDDITIRGFRINGQSNTQLINGLRTSTGFWKQPLANYLERVEVLKGPSSALFGNASPGGVVNRVTKKPLDINRKSLSFSTGSFNTFRALSDFTGPISKDSSLLYRLNLGYEDAGSFRDLQFDKNIIIAPSVSFLPSEQTSLNFDIVYNNSMSRLDRGQAVFDNNDLHSTPISQSINSSNDYLNEVTYTVSASLNHRFARNFSFTTAYMKTGYSEDLMEHRGANAYAVDGDGNTIPNLVAMQVFKRKRNRFIDNLSTYFNYQVNTGLIEHKLLAGYDYAQEELPAGSSQLQASGYLNASNTGAITRYNPSNKDLYLLDSNGNPVPNVPHFDLTDPLASYRMKDESKYFYVQRAFDPTFYHLHGIYAQDLVKIGKLQALVGLRYEEYMDIEGYKSGDENRVYQSALLPRFGLIYSVLPNVNLYGTYVEGYNPQTASTISNPNAGGPFDPLMSDMFEAGAKSEWFQNRLSTTVALYRIRQKNALYNAGDAENPDLLRQVGEEESKGIELDVTGRILYNWSIIASYAYNEAAISKSPVEDEVGLQKPNAPKHQGNIWSRYTVAGGLLEGLGIGLGSNFVTERVLSLDSEQTIPGYVLVDAALYYEVNKVRVQFNLNNVFDRTHWVGGYDYLRLFPGKPRNYLVTLGYTF